MEGDFCCGGGWGGGKRGEFDEYGGTPEGHGVGWGFKVYGCGNVVDG